MASSLGYALMSWSTAMAKHSKAKRKARKKQPCSSEAGNKAAGARTTSSAISEFEYVHQQQEEEQLPAHSEDRVAAADVQSNETQTEESPAADCDRCAELSDEVCHLISQLSDVELLQDDLKRKLSTTKSTLATAIDRESKLRSANESMQLEEAQTRYELNQIKVEVLQQLEEQQKCHDDRVKAINETMQERECEWANKNASLQQELSRALQSSLMDTQREEWSLSSLEKEIASLQTVIELRGGENRQLREENNKLKNKLDDHHWLETELGKAKHRLEELTIIVQNKMVSERELLELSEALQRDLVRCRNETILLKQKLEMNQLSQQCSDEQVNSSRRPPPQLTVKHSHSDLFNNNRTNTSFNNERNRKLSSLQQIGEWADHDKAISNVEQQTTIDLRNQHQKASCGSEASATSDHPNSSAKITPDLVLDLQEKAESVAWRLQMEPKSATKSSNSSPRPTRRNQKKIC